MKKTTLLFALISGLALTPAVAAAQYGATDTQAKDMPATQEQGKMMRGAEGPMRDAAGASESSLFEQLDTDKNGYIDAKEAERSATTKAKFREADKSQDGRLSHEEWKAGGLK